MRLSLEPDVLRLGGDGGEDVLLGSRCTVCGRYFMPQRKWCGNCAEPTTETVELSREGTLSSFSRMTRKPDYALVEVPYILGEVALQEGIAIYSVIRGADVADLSIGQKVVLSTVEIRKDEAGRSVIAYSFVPVRTPRVEGAQ